MLLHSHNGMLNMEGEHGGWTHQMQSTAWPILLAPFPSMDMIEVDHVSNRIRQKLYHIPEMNGIEPYYPAVPRQHVV